MRVVVALGGNALLRRGEPLTAENQRANARAACEALAPVALEHELVDLARQRPAGRAARAAGLRLHGGRDLPARRPRRADRGDDRLPHPAGARERAAVREAPRDAPDDDRGRPRRPGVRRTRRSRSARSTTRTRPTRSPARRAGRSSPTATASAASSPRRCRSGSSSIEPIESLLEHGCVVICAGGGGIPTMYTDEPAPAGRRLVGVEAVIDKDLASALLAIDLARRRAR